MHGDKYLPWISSCKPQNSKNNQMGANIIAICKWGIWGRAESSLNGKSDLSLEPNEN